MASSAVAHRAVAVGLSGGLGVALPLAAFAASMPFSDIHELVRPAAVPFAVGALAGVGLLALSGHLMDAHEARLAAEKAEAASFASTFGGAQAAAPRTARNNRGKSAVQPKGVPVIARAVDALDEADAWAEIDATFAGDSPISCDPSKSKDIYEIALDELRRAEQTRTARADSYAPQAGADSTATFMSLAGAQPAPVAARAAAPVENAWDTNPTFYGDAEAAAAREAAMAALYGSGSAYVAPQPNVSAVWPAQSAVPAQQGAPAAYQSPAAYRQAPVAYQSPAAYQAPSAWQQQSSSATPASPTAQPAAQVTAQTVPVADYSGHEDMWAAALAIMDEDLGPESSAAVPVAAVAAAPEAVAEGARNTRIHAHVNDILGEELDRSSSSSVRRTSHEYLHVIQGGTASLPRLQAEA